jgi:chorismate mutase/catechol 2,3-dioxygenase-like lactoylglutathione lyase family enzyme
VSTGPIRDNRFSISLLAPPKSGRLSAVATLLELRTAIDQADRDLLAVLARRFELCNEVAAVKGEAQSQVLQPARVQEVLRTRTAWAAEVGVEPEFAELIFRSLLSETHRIEAVHLRDRQDPATADESAPARVPAVDTALQTTACRIDHVTVAVDDLTAATAFFVDRLGFRVGQSRSSHPDYPGLDSVVVDAGGVTFVLLQADASHPGEPLAIGVHHIAIEVLNAAYVRSALADQGCPLQTDVLTSHNGLERFFTVRDASSGLQLGFVSRVGDRANFDGGDVAALSTAIELVADL